MKLLYTCSIRWLRNSTKTVTFSEDTILIGILVEVLNDDIIPCHPLSVETYQPHGESAESETVDGLLTGNIL